MGFLPAHGGGRYTLQACWLFVALFVVTFGAFVVEGPLRSLFSVTPLRWLGNMSYSYYLVHALTLKALALGLSRAQPGWKPGAIAHWAFLPVAFAATLASSAALFLLIEKRFSLAPQQRPVSHPAIGVGAIPVGTPS